MEKRKEYFKEQDSKILIRNPNSDDLFLQLAKKCFKSKKELFQFFIDEKFCLKLKPYLEKAAGNFDYLCILLKYGIKANNDLDLLPIQNSDVLITCLILLKTLLNCESNRSEKGYIYKLFEVESNDFMSFLDKFLTVPNDKISLTLYVRKKTKSILKLIDKLDQKVSILNIEYLELYNTVLLSKDGGEGDEDLEALAEEIERARQRAIDEDLRSRGFQFQT